MTDEGASDKTAALAEIARLANMHDISLREIEGKLSRDEIDRNSKNPATITRFLTVIGCVFLLAGFYGYMTVYWPHLSTFWRIAGLLVPGGAAYLLMFVFSSASASAVYFNAAAICSALLQTAGLFVAAAEGSTGNDRLTLASIMIFSALAAQYAFAFFSVRRAAPLLFALMAMLWALGLCLQVVGLPIDLTSIMLGSTIICISYAVARTPFAVLSGIGYFVGSLLMLMRGYPGIEFDTDTIHNIFIASVLIYVSSIARSYIMLWLAALSLFGDIILFTRKYFVDSYGWPLSLIVLGILLISLLTLCTAVIKHIDKKPPEEF